MRELKRLCAEPPALKQAYPRLEWVEIPRDSFGGWRNGSAVGSDPTSDGSISITPSHLPMGNLGQSPNEASDVLQI